MSPTTRAALSTFAFILLAGCNRFDRAERARDAEIAILSHLTFKQAAEPGRCIDENCVSQEAGFAYAKQKAVLQADDCIGKGDEDFVEGCRQYAEDVDEAYRDAVEK